MGLFNFRKKKVENEKREAQQECLTYLNKNTYTPGLFFGTYSEHAPMSLSAVFSAIDIISNSLAELPILVKKKEEDADNIVTTHPVYTSLKNMTMSKFIFIKKLITDMLLQGNGFAYIKRDVEGNPIELVYLPKGSVSVDFNEATGKLRYLTTAYPYVPKTVEPKNMLHFYKNTNDGYTGVGILSYANRSFQIANYTEESVKDFFGSGCNIKGILKMVGQSGLILTDAQKEAIRTSWQQVHGGSGNSGLAIMPANLDFIPVSQNASESQMVETRTFNVQEVARFFNMSPVMLQDLSHSSYSTIEASQLEFLTHTLLPYISMMENELNKKLINDDNYFIDLDENYLMTSDKSATANYLTSLTSKGIMTVNEARFQLGLPKIDGGDKLLVLYTNTEQNDVTKDTQKED